MVVVGGRVVAVVVVVRVVGGTGVGVEVALVGTVVFADRGAIVVAVVEVAVAVVLVEAATVDVVGVGRVAVGVVGVVVPPEAATTGGGDDVGWVPNAARATAPTTTAATASCPRVNLRGSRVNWRASFLVCTSTGTTPSGSGGSADEGGGPL